MKIDDSTLKIDDSTLKIDGSSLKIDGSSLKIDVSKDKNKKVNKQSEKKHEIFFYFCNIKFKKRRYLSEHLKYNCKKKNFYLNKEINKNDYIIEIDDEFINNNNKDNNNKEKEIYECNDCNKKFKKIIFRCSSKNIVK